MRSAQPGSQSPKVEVRSEDIDGAGRELLTRSELAAALRVSVRTVDAMVAGNEIPSVRIGSLVRFYLPDVVRHLTATAVTSKRRCARATI
jgi:excisionase family DNA binding protein